MISQTEENYLKTIFTISNKEKGPVSTNHIAEALNTSPASVSDMLKRLKDKRLIDYEKYKGVLLSKKGKSLATNLVRKHRLWESFLVQTLKFDWSEVHEIAEQLEHIKSPTLIKKLDEFLGFPKFDPHGDPIPNDLGEFTEMSSDALNELGINEKAKVVGVHDSDAAFLTFLDKIGIGLGSVVEIKDINGYDSSLIIEIKGKGEYMISEKVSANIQVKRL